MSCSSCSPTATSTYNSASNPCGCGGLPMPRRVASPPVVPVTIYRLSMSRQALSGKLVLSGCNDEVLTLDGGLSGPVLFNAETGKVEVGSTDAAATIQDNFACADSALSGLLLMGKDPGCREPGQNPDREIVAVRMTNADTADLIGAVPQCATSSGRAPEITPVKVTPIALDGVLHANGIVNPSTLSFKEESAVDCNGIRRTLRKWFSFQHWHQPDVNTVEETDALSGDSQNIWFTMWKKITVGANTTYRLVKVTEARFREIIESYSPGGGSSPHMVPLEPPTLIATSAGGQINTGNYALPGKTVAWLLATCFSSKTDTGGTGSCSAAVSVNGFNYCFAVSFQGGGQDNNNYVVFPVKVNSGNITYNLTTIENVPNLNLTEAKLYLIGSE